jgi:hypothetical protein
LSERGSEITKHQQRKGGEVGRRHKHRRGDRSITIAGISLEEQRARIDALIAAGKTRDAVEVAKQFFKETRGPETEALVVTAYQARIDALAAAGMPREARALAALVSERFPACRDRFASLIGRSELRLAGNVPALLAELATADTARRRELEAILTRELADPEVLADSPALPSDDPLKRAGRAVCDLFMSVTTGPLPDGVLGRLDEIPRHSPLAPWKLLIRALDAFYRRADGAVLANLSAIPAHSGPGRLVPILRRLVGDAGAREDRSLAVATLLDKVSGGRVPFERHVRELAESLARKDGRRAAATIQDLLKVLSALPAGFRRTCIATVLDQWFRLDLNPEPLIHASLRGTRDLDTLRLLALAVERTGIWDTALGLWDRYLTAAIQTRVLPSSGPEVCRVLLRMTDLFPSDQEEVLDFFDVRSEDELRDLIRARVLPECFDRGRLLERARAASPEPQVFRALVAHYETREPRRAEAEAEAWRRDRPQDLEPLLYLMRAAERRGAHRRALDLLAEAESINGVHPEVRQSRFRLLLASAERRIREGKLARALADLDQLEREPRANEGDHMAYFVALRWAAARRNGDAGAAMNLEQALVSRTRNPVLFDLVLRSVAGVFDIDVLEPRRPCSQPEVIEGVARAFDLFHGLDRPLTVSPELFAQIEKGCGGASVAQLHSLCACGLTMARPAVTYVASGRGLADDGPLLHRFLLARGRALRTASSAADRDRGRRCLRAARELAGRARDMEAVREASAALDTIPSETGFDRVMPDDSFNDDRAPAQEEIMRTVAAERRSPDIPRFAVEKARSARRRRRRPREPDLFEELVALLRGQP